MKEIIQKLSDQELKQLIDEYHMSPIPEDALLRKIVIEYFGKIDIFTLQITMFLWPILQVVSERMISYSPHIKK